MRRVVITGLGTVNPLGNGVSHTWDKLIAGESGIQKIENFDTSDLVAKVGGVVPRGEEKGEFNPKDYLSPKEIRRTSDFILFAIAAADEALADSGYIADTEEKQARSGVVIGGGVGGIEDSAGSGITVNLERTPRKLSPFFLPSILINLAAGQVSIRHHFKGPNCAAVTACATGTHAIADAARLIGNDEADVILTGSAESSICRVSYAAFSAMKALSSTEDPKVASTPWNKSRNGFVMGEGAGVLVLEEYEHAKARGAKIYAEIVGYGMSGDAHHITAPAPDGSGAFRAMNAAVKRAGINANEIDYINAHGTSTPLGDMLELKAIKKLLGDDYGKTTISSTKSAIGHLLGASGSVEGVFLTKALSEGVIPPTLNLTDPDDDAQGFDLTPLESKKRDIKYALSNSFGFGGTNGTILIKKMED